VYLFITVSILYKISRYIAIGDADLAFSNAYAVANFEKNIGIFYEIPLQQLFLDKTKFVKFLNSFYTSVHVPSIIAFFIWLYQKHRNNYKLIRNCFLIANFLTLFIFISFPCAPPRMLTDLGFVDTLLEISKVNLYSGVRAHLFNQYAAMPSMHFGTSLLIGVCVFLLAKNSFIRFVMLLYPLFVLLVIVVTGNHFFLDAIVGGTMTALPFFVVWINKMVTSHKTLNNTSAPIMESVEMVNEPIQ
jgi:F0F1-type ATP synthase assembly protein I